MKKVQLFFFLIFSSSIQFSTQTLIEHLRETIKNLKQKVTSLQDEKANYVGSVASSQNDFNDLESKLEQQAAKTNALLSVLNTISELDERYTAQDETIKEIRANIIDNNVTSIITNIRAKVSKIENEMQGSQLNEIKILKEKFSELVVRYRAQDEIIEEIRANIIDNNESSIITNITAKVSKIDNEMQRFEGDLLTLRMKINDNENEHRSQLNETLSRHDNDTNLLQRDVSTNSYNISALMGIMHQTENEISAKIEELNATLIAEGHISYKHLLIQKIGLVLAREGIIDCHHDSNCADDYKCTYTFEQFGRLLCQKTCQVEDPCAVPFTECVGTNHQSTCHCQDGFEGDGSVECIPTGFVTKDNGRKYKLLDRNLTSYRNASKRCDNLGARLPVLDSKETIEIVGEFAAEAEEGPSTMGNYKRVWVGLEFWRGDGLVWYDGNRVEMHPASARLFVWEARRILSQVLKYPLYYIHALYFQLCS